MDPAYCAVRSLYCELTGREGLHASALAQWQTAFEQLHGPIERKRRVDRAAVARAYSLDDEISLPHLLFAVETFLALYLVASLETLPTSASERDRTRRLHRLVAGQDRSELPLTRLADAYISHLPGVGDEAVIDAIATGIEDQLALDAQSRDVFDDAFRRHYHALIPKQVRHSIGAHFTPAWLSEYALTLADVTPEVITRLSLLDPTCGSGQFLLSAARVLACAVDHGYATPVGARNAMLQQMGGLELNPLAALAANVNLVRVAAAIGGSVPQPELFPFPVRLTDTLLDTETVGPPGGEFDAIVGNPPWVNWEHLPPHYRTQIEHLWPQLGLFSLKGRDRVFSKEDVSGLFLYVAADRYLKRGGRLTFVMPQSVFKSPLNARGFRRFRIGDDREPLRVIQVDDLSGIRVFADAANRTAVVTVEKGSPTTYPVPYLQWRKIGRINERMRWTEVESAVARAPHVAFPTIPAQPTSHWTSVDRRAVTLFEKLTGACPYKGRTGIFTGGANGVYYLKLLEAGTDVALVHNVTERTRRPVPDVVRALETTYLFPLVRGRDVSETSLTPELAILCPHTAETGMQPLKEDVLAAQVPLTMQYLREFESILRQRRGFTAFDRKIFEESFYALQRIGNYTFAPYKVVWRYIAPRFIVRVIPPATPFGDPRPQIPNEKLMLIPFNNADEAYYVAGMLASSAARFFVESQMVGTQISASIVSELGLPAYDDGEEAHCEVARVAAELHALPRHASDAERQDLRCQLDRLVAEVLDLSATQSTLLVELAV